MKSLLETKFHIPKPTPYLLLRPRLIDKLDGGRSRKLILVSASAGFGKSTLLSQWVSTITHPVGWLSLDSEDDDPSRFLAYMVGALQRMGLNVGQEVLDILGSSQSPPYEAILTSLINECAGIHEDFMLVLDDYHFINDEEIHKLISNVIDKMPRTMHLVISTRLDPSLPLARMRASQELLEVRSKDLRLTVEETALLLMDVFGLKLEIEEIQALDEYVEGWAAGLQMVVLSLQSREDVSGFIKSFSGHNRFILDYLMEEVLARQSAEIREFLLMTSILERLNAPLCNALRDRQDSQRILIHLEQSNMFMIPLDDEQKWYRYHHLFTDLLQKHLTIQCPDQISDLHTRASIWFDSQGHLTEALSHAINGKNLDRAARLYEKYGLTVMSFNQGKNLSSWLDLLPVEVIRNQPWLCILQAWLHYSIGTRADAEEYLQAAEEYLDRLPSVPEQSPPPVQPRVSERQRLVGAIASIRAHISIVEGDIQSVLRQVDLAFKNLPGNDPRRTTAMVAQGVAYWALGDRSRSEKTFAESSAAYLKKKNWDGLVSSLCYKGIMQVKHGDLQSAHRTFNEALDRATMPGGTKILFASIPFIRIGDLMREWNDLARAQEYIDSGISLAEKLNHPDVSVEAHICNARLQFACKNQAGIISALKNAEQVLAGNRVDPWYLGWLDECWLRFHLSNGNLAGAVSQVKRRGLTLTAPLSYHHDLHHINLARVLLAQGVQDPSGPFLDQAGNLLKRLQEAAEKAGWIHETVKVLILTALLLWLSGEKAPSAEVLLRALILAEPGGYIRLFVDEGAPVEELLSYFLVQEGRGMAVDVDISGYAAKLLQTLKNEKLAVTPASPGVLNLLEPLSYRELEVLRYLNTHLSSTEIGSELSISANTVRFHIKNIYGKLNVNRRTDAVRRARESGFL